MSEWRSRYRGDGVLVYWHVETNAVCIYAQARNFSHSEVAAMVEGLIRHDTEMRVEKNFVDSHGQSSAGPGETDAAAEENQIRAPLFARQGDVWSVSQSG